MSTSRRAVTRENNLKRRQANEKNNRQEGQISAYLRLINATTDAKIQELHKLHNELNDFHNIRLIMKPDNMLARLDSIERRFLRL